MGILMIYFKSFKEKIRITKEFDHKGSIEVIDNKYLYIVLKDKLQ